MNKLFIPYEQALAMSDLGYDEKCLGLYTNNPSGPELLIGEFTVSPDSEFEIYAPLWQQAFQYFRDLGYKFYINSGTLNMNKQYVDWYYRISRYGDVISEIDHRDGFMDYETARNLLLEDLIMIEQNRK